MKIGEKNVGTGDRIIRIIVGIFLIAIFAMKLLASPYSYLVVFIGLIALLTGIFGTCALYSVFGITTAEQKKA